MNDNDKEKPHHADDGTGRCKLCLRPIQAAAVHTWPCPAGCGNPIDKVDKDKRMRLAAMRSRKRY